jgi:hypothetical protein
MYDKTHLYDSMKFIITTRDRRGSHVNRYTKNTNWPKKITKDWTKSKTKLHLGTY